MSYIVASCSGTRGSEINAPQRCVEAAQELFRKFHRFPPPRLMRLACRRVIPQVVVHVGALRGLIYTSDKRCPGRSRTYIHFMRQPPILACDPRGTQLYILGGRYRITPRGIDG